MGELQLFYAASDVAFVGGSLVPAGGHNVLEPAGLGVPVLVGPHTFNISAVCKMLEEEGALRYVSDAEQLARAVCHWFSDSNGRDSAGAAGKRAVEKNRGASDRVMKLLECYL
jgi:3-deoxy-D-manno-octulosonic-acid transferase